jgi:hypothetical protein
MKTKTPKPRVMWANIGAHGWSTHSTHLDAIAAQWDGDQTVRVAIIPLEDVEAIVERAAMACGFGFENTRIALTAAGIPCLKRKARK